MSVDAVCRLSHEFRGGALSEANALIHHPNIAVSQEIQSGRAVTLFQANNQD